MSSSGWVCAFALAGCAVRGPAVTSTAPMTRRPAVARSEAPASTLRTQVPPSELRHEDDAQRQIRELRRAQALFRTFIEKAGDRGEFRDAVSRSRERIDDIEQTIDFLGGSLPATTGRSGY